MSSEATFASRLNGMHVVMLELTVRCLHKSSDIMRYQRYWSIRTVSATWYSGYLYNLRIGVLETTLHVQTSRSNGKLCRFLLREVNIQLGQQACTAMSYLYMHYFMLIQGLLWASESKSCT